MFAVGAYLLQNPGFVALVDLGLGPTNMQTATGATYTGGALLTNLAASGIAPGRSRFRCLHPPAPRPRRLDDQSGRCAPEV